MKEIASLIGQAVRGEALADVRARVDALVTAHPAYPRG
jgi:hypothetical protein